MTSKGQVTVPIEVRRQLGLRQGDRVAFDVEDGVATLRPLPAEPDAFDDRAIELDDEPLIERLHGELAQATGLDADPLEVTVQRWPTTMPQLEVGHHERLATIRSALARDLPGVVVAGAPYHGPGLSSCLRSATGAATTLTTALQETHA